MRAILKSGFARVLSVALLGISASAVRAQTDGIYADVNTSMGSFTCRLEYATSPKAVANFIGLATGQRPWLDLTNGAVRTDPFFNGLIFHRVITNFVIQSGSRNSQGTDGPGYSFVDEFSPSLRHDGFGVLSMANSGPDSNGSQFFITLAAQPSLNDAYTVFGRVVGGSNVVDAIGRVATSASDRPLTNVVIQTVNIRRVGSAAQAFDINGQGLAIVTNLPMQIGMLETNVSLSFSNQLYVDNRIYSSLNLRQWAATKLGIVTESPSNRVTTAPIDAARFFKMVQIQYPPSLFVPEYVANHTFALTFNGGGTLTLTFDSAGAGTYTDGLGGVGTVTGYNWTQDPYRGRFSFISFSTLSPMVLHLDFDSATIGTFKGTVYPSYPSSANSFLVSGTFGGANP